MKKWLQREKKRLLHEVRSKAHRRMNLVVLVCFLIMVLYEKVGKPAWSVDVANSVPMLWKCLTFLTMFATIWYVNWRIERRVFDLSLPAPKTGWIVWLVLIAFAFAVVSADVRTLFHVGTYSCLIFCLISDRYYRRKGERLREHETRLA
jgi:uncharacterized membrane protein YhaH (DUF805 family)